MAQPEIVLVVDDDLASREALQQDLSQAGYQVTVAADGRAALDVLWSGAPPNLLLLDMLMPDVDGWGVLDEIQQLCPGLRVIIVTALPAISGEWVKAHNCAGFVRKPYDAGTLLAEVQRCLAAPPPTVCTPA